MKRNGTCTHYCTETHTYVENPPQWEPTSVIESANKATKDAHKL